MVKLEITEIILVNCNIASNDYQHDSRDLYRFVPNKLFGQLLDIKPKTLYFQNHQFRVFIY